MKEMNKEISRVVPEYKFQDTMKEIEIFSKYSNNHITPEQAYKRTR